MDNNSQKNINFNHLSKEEKAHLKKRISTSVYGYIKRKRLLKYGIGVTAAVVVIFVSIGIFNSPASQLSPIEVFAKNVKDLESLSQVQLVLSEDQNIEITEDHSSITYSSTGEEVQIGNSHSINQKTSHKNAPVFNTLIVPFGKRSEIVLSDGSKVWLNSGSKLIFPAQFSEDKREVYLQGEAIFEVAHRQKQPFMVKSDHHEIEVLGTVFNVSNYTDDQAIYTVLQSGSVQINVTEDRLFNAQKHIKIAPGTLATFDKNDRAVKTQSVATEPYFSWRDGIFIFKNDSLKSIMKKISRYYNVEIIINNYDLANETFSGYLDVKETIEHVMQTFKATESPEFEYYLTQDNQLIIN
ncbi:FecR family protein [Gelidibacter sp.]|uniref:FecR family protein n=1 Tax=Gelidibacter sp. TaxID=2018083 RepID=UPI002B83D1E2|nr:FecR domain-containing protein [Gelidibacter sp.]HUH29043.1 FecR domain-containing protein [Gelidibacter sp.]